MTWRRRNSVFPSDIRSLAAKLCLMCPKAINSLAAFCKTALPSSESPTCHSAVQYYFSFRPVGIHRRGQVSPRRQRQDQAQVRMRSALNETTGYSPLGLDGAPPKKTNTKGRADPFRGWWTRRLQSAGFPPSARKRRGRGSTQELAR
jgi:hypothetical protein